MDDERGNTTKSATVCKKHKTGRLNRLMTAGHCHVSLHRTSYSCFQRWIDTAIHK
jgi:hypothetical protein